MEISLDGQGLNASHEKLLPLQGASTTQQLSQGPETTQKQLKSEELQVQLIAMVCKVVGSNLTGGYGGSFLAISSKIS